MALTDHSERIIRHLEALPGRTVRRVLFAVQARAQELAPVDTGALRASVTSEVVDGAGYAEGVAGPTADYGAHVELGTIHTASQPYLLPAFQEVREMIPAIARAEMRQ
jgi:phage protein, HK97 gp10 family